MKKDNKRASTLQEAAKGLDEQHILEAIETGIEYALGAETKMLLFKTLKLVYKLERNAIPSNLERFDELLDRILGVNTAEVVRQQIISELEKKEKDPQT